MPSVIYHVGENDLSEKRIQDVLEIERQAQAVHEAAVSEAEELELQAEREAQAIIEKTRSEAEEQARKIVAKAHEVEEESARILAQAESSVRGAEGLAMSNFDRAVSYVLNRVVGKE